MPYSTCLLLALATHLASNNRNATAQPVGQELPEVMEPILNRLRQLVEQFLQHRVTPADVFQFEQQLQELLRELGRVTAQWTYNRLEPEAATLPRGKRCQERPTHLFAGVWRSTWVKCWRFR